MQVRENSHCGHPAARSGITPAGHLGAWVSIHLTAYGLFLHFVEVMPIPVSGLAVRRWLCAVADAVAVGPNIQIIHISPTFFRQIPAYAPADGFGWRLSSKIIRPVATGVEFVLAVCSLLAARLLAVFAVLFNAVWFSIVSLCAVLSGVVSLGPVSYVAVRFRTFLFSSVLFSAVSFGFVSFGFVTPAHAEAFMPLCEATFSGSLPVLKELAWLKVAAIQAQAAGKSDLAVTLYRIYQKSSDQAKADGVDLSGLKEMIDEAEVKENKKRLDEENRREQTRALEEIQLIDGKRMILQPIAPGKFMMGEVGEQIETEITKPYEMAATQTTQLVWRKVVEQAKLKFPGRYDALDPDPSNFKGELNPVEQVSWDDVQLWLGALNELAAQGDAIVTEMMPNHKPGEIYRLPMEAEWEFVVRARGKAQGTYHFGESDNDLGRYGWFSGNSREKTHPVATREPLVIDDREFYDLHGNVWELVQDRYDGALKGGKGPNRPSTGPYRVLRGGGWYHSAQYLRSAFCTYWNLDKRYNGAGFRLVRALP
jgi:formylglycine-generating enzyme required for sulfatase activity